MAVRFLYRGRASVDMVVVAEERMEEVAGGELADEKASAILRG